MDNKIMEVSVDELAALKEKLVLYENLRGRNKASEQEFQEIRNQIVALQEQKNMKAGGPHGR